MFAGKSSKGKHFDTTVSHWWASTGFSVGHQCRGTDELHLKSIAAVLFKKPICLCETVLQNYAALPLYGITVCGLRKKETLTWWHWWATAWQNGKLFFNHKKMSFSAEQIFFWWHWWSHHIPLLWRRTFVGFASFTFYQLLLLMLSNCGINTCLATRRKISVKFYLRNTSASPYTAITCKCS